MSTARVWRPARALAQRRSFSTTPRALDNYAFIGLGRMGYQMARNLQSKLPPGDTIRLYDINRSAAEKLVEEMKTQQAGGAAPEVSTSVSDAAKEAVGFLPFFLPHPPQAFMMNLSLKTLVFTTPPQSVDIADLPPRPQPRLFIDSSTIDPHTSSTVCQLVEDKLPGQGHFVDAPMSGGVVGATAGTLTFMLGSDKSLVGRLEPILLRMGKRVLHCGPQTAGLAAKLANNLLLGIQNIGTAEAMLLGVKLGLDPKVLADVINASTGKCWASEVNNPVPGVVPTAPASRGYEGGFGIELMLKDMKLAQDAARRIDLQQTMATKALDLYERASKDAECKGRDFSVVYQVFDKTNGQGP
uniref:3-hydroxyisobutyrate dehydrogenase n=1 Tax=Podospora anserina (strain S / ATCC MYA-4624 / DSM 980 / FGSC 10383) TaxID=515849 RepID=A0A090CVS5_PODAN|nr:Putative mitochondrial precursor of 3-hydroxyisobutyrate dehydrogenase [Podospora anserina S mat+]